MRIAALAIVVLMLGTTSPSLAQTPPDDNKWVPREEYEQLKKAFEEFREEVRKGTRAQPPAAKSQQDNASLTQELEATQEEIDRVDERMKELINAVQPGNTKFLLTGYAFGQFVNREGEDSTFSAGFNPIFLWHLSDRVLFEGELEVRIEGSGESAATTVELEEANISVIVNDYMTLGGGKFLAPFGIFSERLDPAWINKLVDNPLTHDLMIPATQVGAYVRGGFPIGSAKANYAAFVSNGPVMVVDDPEALGTLNFDNFDDVNDNKAVGLRAGLLLIPELELGYSLEFAQVAPPGFPHVNALMQGVDLTYVKDSNAIGGVFNVMAEWVFTDAGDPTFDPDGSLGFGPVKFNNQRNGGWVQLAYRPSHNSNKFIRSLEGVFRYDRIDNPSGAPDSFDEQLYTIGLDYWINSSTVLKTAYEIDDKSKGDDANAFVTQLAVGF